MRRAAALLSKLLPSLLLAGCILGSERPDLNLEIPATYRQEAPASRSAPDAAIPAVDWWRGFRSSELTSLMQAAQIYNLDIAVAISERIFSRAALIAAPACVGSISFARRCSNTFRAARCAASR